MSGQQWIKVTLVLIAQSSENTCYLVFSNPESNYTIDDLANYILRNYSDLKKNCSPWPQAKIVAVYGILTIVECFNWYFQRTFAYYRYCHEGSIFVEGVKEYFRTLLAFCIVICCWNRQRYAVRIWCWKRHRYEEGCNLKTCSHCTESERKIATQLSQRTPYH